MDPWLEDDETFPDLHEKLLVCLGDALKTVLPPGYSILVRGPAEPVPFVVGGGKPPAPERVPELLGLIYVGTSEPPDPPWLEIRGRAGRLVTAVELLSTTDKGAGWSAYVDRRAELTHLGVNVVEIDLLRRGEHATAVPLRLLQTRMGALDYHVCVTMPRDPDRFHVAPFRLADRLPAFGIPLDPGVPPVVVDLQPLLDRAYDTGRYAQVVDYGRDPDPPLTAEQRAWADTILRAKGLLPGGPT
jgi:hypothetical protein